MGQMVAFDRAGTAPKKFFFEFFLDLRKKVLFIFSNFEHIQKFPNSHVMMLASKTFASLGRPSALIDEVLGSAASKEVDNRTDSSD